MKPYTFIHSLGMQTNVISPDYKCEWRRYNEATAPHGICHSSRFFLNYDGSTVPKHSLSFGSHSLVAGWRSNYDDTAARLTDGIAKPLKNRPLQHRVKDLRPNEPQSRTSACGRNQCCPPSSTDH